MTDVCATAMTDPAGERRRSRARTRYNAAMKLVRRVHMYFGLFLIPWVFLYGVSALLFNHPDAFPDREVRTFDRSEAVGTALDDMPDAPALAAMVVEALNARPGHTPCRLSHPTDATFSRPFNATAISGGREHSIRYDFDDGTAIVRSTGAASAPPRGLADGEVIPLRQPPRERLARGVLALLGRSGVKADAVTVRNPPDLIFDLDAEGLRWRAAYNLQTERLSVRPTDDPAGRLSTRRFLTGLHLAFGYPSRSGTRWLWAAVVDVMAVAMVLWGCTGLLMWWQMKALRRSGAIALAASVLVAFALALGMHAVLAR